MHVARNNDEVLLQFSRREKQVLLHTIEVILENYRTKPGELDPKTAAVWYSTRGCKSAGMSAEETREWIDSLYSFKGAHAELMEQWSGQIKEVEPSKFELAIKVEHAPSLVTIINDHRLHLAAQYGIGEPEMDLRQWIEEEELTPEKQAALVQIEILGWLIELILRLIAPEAASWSDTLESPDELA